MANAAQCVNLNQVEVHQQVQQQKGAQLKFEADSGLGIVRLKLQSSGRLLIVMGVHFLTATYDPDYTIKSREISRVLQVARRNLQLYPDAALLLAGDFNMDSTKKPAPEFLKVLQEAPLDSPRRHTFVNLFDNKPADAYTSCTPSRTEWIDYMFYAGRGMGLATPRGIHAIERGCTFDRQGRVIEYARAPEGQSEFMPNTEEPSDHLPLFAKLSIKAVLSSSGRSSSAPLSVRHWL